MNFDLEGEVMFDKQQERQQIAFGLEGGLPAVSGNGNSESTVSIPRKTLVVGTTLLVVGSASFGVAIGAGINQHELVKAENKAAITNGQVSELDNQVLDLCDFADKLRQRRR